MKKPPYLLTGSPTFVLPANDDPAWRQVQDLMDAKVKAVIRLLAEGHDVDLVVGGKVVDTIRAPRPRR